MSTQENSNKKWIHTHTVLFRMGIELSPRMTPVCRTDDGKLWLEGFGGYFREQDGYALAGTYQGRIYPALTQDQDELLELVSLDPNLTFKDLDNDEQVIAKHLKSLGLIDFITSRYVIVLTDYGTAYAC